ncbi:MULTISPECIES: DUF2878 domain-containing protein [Desulfosediminicola]|uniref:DUF2878 domain-containing protein n=1 Tax=Desulfosediminicola TaxID=2886823 RepID=UPI0010AB8E04|nr:DUF2878 domain-containing protein [Desulfosediminicola ganghwensis]
MQTLANIRPLPKLWMIVTNFAVYQLNWLICIFGQNSFLWLALLLIACHMLVSPSPGKDMVLMAIITICGITLDGLLKAIGFFSFSSDFWPIPLWLITVWMTLGLLPNHSLNWLKGRWLLSALLGAIGGPVAYWAGVRLGVASFNWSTPSSLLLLALLWALFWPLMMFCASKVSPKTEVTVAK